MCSGFGGDLVVLLGMRIKNHPLTLGVALGIFWPGHGTSTDTTMGSSSGAGEPWRVLALSCFASHGKGFLFCFFILPPILLGSVVRTLVLVDTE